MRKLFYIITLFCLFIGNRVAFGQGQTDSLPLPKNDTATIPVHDSLTQGTDSATSLKGKIPGIKIAKDGIDAEVTTTADDSAVLDIKNKVFYLYKNATAKYQDIEVDAGRLIYHQDNNNLEALPLFDSSGKVMLSHQIFKQGTEQFTYDTLRYNFKSQRAIVRNARTQYGEGFVISQQVKRNADESIYGWQSIYTTCDLPHPHFGIRAKKIKVIPNKLIASGPANLVIADIPTPLYLPFGVFPISAKQHSGFILPSYTIEEQRGLGLQRGGYYFSVSDHLGLITQFDFFSKGSWGFFSTAQYASKYHYDGSFSLNYTLTKLGETFETNSSVSKDFQVTWTHQVDPKAHPGTTLNANVNFGTSSYNSNNGMDNYNNILDNQYSSSISYGKTWQDKPYSLTMALRHSQSTQSHQVTISLPEIDFSLGQFTPFKRKVQIGNPKWYEKISVSYSVTERNNWNFLDTAIHLNQLKFRDFDNGIMHNLSIGAGYTVLKYFTLSFSLPYQEYWNTKKTFYNRDLQTNGIDTVTQMGFFASRQFSLSSSLSTRIYGVKMFKRGKLMGIRHVMTPSLSATYTPGFAHSPFGYMYETIDPYGFSTYQSPYTLSPIGGPNNPNSSGAVGFSVNNTLAIKVRTPDEDSGSTQGGSKNVSIIDGFAINGNYNLFADSFRMSMINMSLHTQLLNKINISANAVFDPYKYQDGRRTPEYLASDTWYKLASFRSANFSFGFNLRGGNKRSDHAVDSAKNNNHEVNQLLSNGGINDYFDFNIPWNLSMNGGLAIIKQPRLGRSDTLIYSPNLTFSGGFNLTQRWQINFNSGLQFQGLKDIKMGLTNINISRDLHCWQMSLNLVPFGVYRSFNFTLNVKASVLQDLKLVRRKTYQDNF